MPATPPPVHPPTGLAAAASPTDPPDYTHTWRVLWRGCGCCSPQQEVQPPAPQIQTQSESGQPPSSSSTTIPASDAAPATTVAGPGGPPDAAGAPQLLPPQAQQLPPAPNAFLAWCTQSLGLPLAYNAWRPDFFLLLLCAAVGARQPTLELLPHMQLLPSCPFMWPAFGSRSLGDGALCTLALSACRVLEDEAPEVAGAFETAGFSAAHVAARWLSTCFAGVLRRDEAVKLLCVLCVLGPDYASYCCVALMLHLRPVVLVAASRGELVSALHGLDVLWGFDLSDQMHVLGALCERHRGRVLGAMWGLVLRGKAPQGPGHK